MKNKNIGGGLCFVNSTLSAKKAPMQKCEKIKKISNIEKNCLARFAHSAFYKINISGAANPHAPVQYANICCCCFLSSHHDTNPLLHLYHFRKKNIIIYWLILTVNHQGSFFLS